MDIMKIALLGIIGVMLTVWVKSYKSEYGILLGSAVCLLLAGYAINCFSQITQAMERLGHIYDNSTGYFEVLFKAIGATYLSEISAGICKDAGYSGIAGQVEMIGKLYVFVLGLPILMALLDGISKIPGV